MILIAATSLKSTHLPTMPRKRLRYGTDWNEISQITSSGAEPWKRNMATGLSKVSKKPPTGFVMKPAQPKTR